MSLFTPPRVTPHRGCASVRCTLANRLSAGERAIGLWPYGVTGTCLAMAHMQAHQLTGHGHGDHGGMFASCHESSGALTPPDLGLPADVLDDLGWCFQSPWQMSADLGGIAVGPGAFDQSPSGLGVTGFGHGTLLAPLTEAYAEGIKPKHFISALGVSKRLRSPTQPPS